MNPEESTRLRHLITAFRMLGGVQVHPTWERLEKELHGRILPSGDIALLAADPGSNRYDGLAAYWGLRKGLDTAKVTQISESGVS